MRLIIAGLAAAGATVALLVSLSSAPEKQTPNDARPSLANNETSGTKSATKLETTPRPASRVEPVERLAVERDITLEDFTPDPKMPFERMGDREQRLEAQRQLRKALDRVPEEKRPKVLAILFDAQYTYSLMVRERQETRLATADGPQNVGGMNGRGIAEEARVQIQQLLDPEDYRQFRDTAGLGWIALVKNNVFKTPVLTQAFY